MIMYKSVFTIPGILLVLMFFAEVLVAGPSVTAKENFETLLKTKSCRNCDLSGLNFNRMDLAGADLVGADLSMSKFFLANLAGADLKNAKLNGALFGGADLGEADLRGADLRGASIDSAYLGGAKMSGRIVTTTPYEDDGIGDVEQEIYLEDQSVPKKNPAPAAVKVGERRDLGETPPVFAQSQKREVKGSVEMVPPTQRPEPPAVKSVTPVKELVIKEKELQAQKKSTPPQPLLSAPQSSAELKKVANKEYKDQSSTVISSASSVKPSREGTDIYKEKEEPPKIIEKNIKEDTVASSQKKGAVLSDEKPETGKIENLHRLLDKNRCYGCDLSGMDLSGKDLEDADLEKADLTGANLTKADLEGANLKGAILRGAILVNADLREADLYKADLRDADLSGAKQKHALFDNALMDGVVGASGGSMMLGK